MAFFVISISSNSSEDCIGMSIARVILFGMIPTTIPSTTPTVNLPIIHDDTPLIPTDTLTISPVVPTIPPIAPTIQYTSLFIYNDSSDNGTPDSPPSQDPYEILPAPPRLPRRPAILLFLGQPIPVGRPYHSSLETLSYSHSDSSSDSSLGYAILETPCDSPTTTSKRPSRKRCRSPLIPVSLPMPGALSPVRTNLSQPPRRISDSDSMMDLEVSLEDGYESYVPREVGLGVDVEDNYEPYTESNVDTDVQAYIDKCIAYTDAIRVRGMDDRDVVETTAADEVKSSAR
ncbi:hypothetical protein Tco_0036026, partial [Tanacetum coccineum]